MFAASKSGSVDAKDAQFKNVTMLLHGNGTNGAQNNTFLDSSTNNFTITRNGNTTQGTFTPYGSNWSNYFDGSGDYLSVPTASAVAFGTGDFTVEMWIYANTLSGVYVPFDSRGGGTGFCFYTNGATINVAVGGATNWFTGASINLNSWVHIAVTRASSTARLFVNGALVSSGTQTTNFGNNTTYIGQDSFGASQYWPGYISNVRVVNGTAVYTAAFTPSTTPLTAISGTSLLTCQSNRFIDNSTNNFTITRSGDTSVQRFSPFSPTTAYSTSVIGGSGYFDGSGDYLSTPSTGQFAPTGDFTISCWYYPTSTRAYQQIIGNFNGSASTVWIFEITSGTGISFYTNGITPRISGSGLVVNAWNYLVLARSGSTITGYVNGVSLGTYTQSGTFGSATQSISIGRAGSSTAAGDFGLGYIADVKLIDGSAVTTVPTAPQTATSGTNLLLSYTNAGILDNAMMNDLETVGNAQISTSVKKYGTGSLYFDGTGDGLQAIGTPNTAFGTGDFTVEFWIYLNANTGSFKKFVELGTSGSCFTIETQSTNNVLNVTDLNNTVFITSSTALSLTTWTHVAVTRSGTSMKLFQNGTQVGSATNSTNFANSGNVYIGQSNSGQAVNCYMDDLRITKGFARYTANFTAPTEAFADKG